jgi:hypothetical protein
VARGVCNKEATFGFCKDGTCQYAHAHDFDGVITWKEKAKAHLEKRADIRKERAARDQAEQAAEEAALADL